MTPPHDWALVKRTRFSSPPMNQIAISSSNDERQQALIRTVQRMSSLEAPIVSLSGSHGLAEILSCRFDPTGQNITACSADRSVSLWQRYAPNTNYGLLANLHKAPILDLQWSLFSPLLYTVSADHTLNVTDLTTGTELVVTGADDGTVRVWEGGDEGPKTPISMFELSCPVTSVCCSADGMNIYGGALDNKIHVLDLCKNEQVYSLTGHTDMPTSLSLSPNRSFLLSPSFSSQTIIHNVRPFSPSPAHIHRVLMSAPAGLENILLRGVWSKDDNGRHVAVGGVDRTVCMWDVESGKVLYK
ncbi:WD40 repeat-like protein, partial [Laetiporus sulphureus 93-53]